MPSGEPIVTVNKVGKGSVVFVAVPDLLGEDERMTPFAAHMLAHVFADAVPVKVTGDVEYLINRTANGWVVTLLNNNGVFKTQQGMAQVDRSAYVNVDDYAARQQIELPPNGPATSTSEDREMASHHSNCHRVASPSSKSVKRGLTRHRYGLNRDCRAVEFR